MINGVTKVIMTKADVLDKFPELKVCNSYSIDGKEKSEIPFQMTRHKITPVLKDFEGWNCDTTSAKNFTNLPQKMKTYVSYINEYIGANVSHISNGPGRDQIVVVD